MRYATYRLIMLPCCSLLYKLMFIRFSDERKVEQKLFSEKIKQIAQNATNGSGLVAIRNSFTSDCSRGLHEIYRIVIVLTKA